MIVDNDQQVQVIDGRLDALEGMPISDDRSAREAFTHVVVTVNRINQLSARTQAQAVMGAATPVDDILEKLREWLDRLLSALTRIVAKLAGPRHSRSQSAARYLSPSTSDPSSRAGVYTALYDGGQPGSALRYLDGNHPDFSV